MIKILMIYASMSGNTEIMADVIFDYIKGKNHEIVKKSFDFDPIQIDELLNYDGILIGTYTYDEGDLPYEVEDFYEELDDIELTGKMIGVFGSCDSFYDSFGGAIDTMAAKVKDRGGMLYDKGLKVDLEPDKKDIERLREFAEGFLGKIN
ncbi:flavodoxin [Virgibacillus oceani]|uniref:Flavodoxin n=1 Tax=Virgibacillus oceani TaxID=1479511 RepID=A0A917M0R2_9BACI|nr:flavodoxin [Virgibacillus oceani]GGG67824.1 flavodoxin [Virgibacillus oceani]